MNADSTKRFSNRALHYARHRPGYPPQLLEFFKSELKLGPNEPIADVGSGTGILTELLLKNGNPVSAVEPNDEMRSIAERLLAKYPNFHSIAGTAEQTTLADQSVRMITAAQAFHWFDRLRAKIEFGRILLPGGWVCLVWNQRRIQEGTFGGAFERFSREFATDPALSQHRALTSGDFTPIRELFSPAAVKVASFYNEQIVDLDGLTGRVLSHSNMPLEGHPRHPAMIERLRQLFEKFQVGGRVRYEYDTKVYYGRFSKGYGIFRKNY